MPAGPLVTEPPSTARRRCAEARVTEEACRALRRGSFPQDPTACLGLLVPHHPFLPLESSCTRRGGSTIRPTGQCSTLELHRGMNIRAWVWTGWEWLPAGQVLLRKEVIQPHLPVRLPCYDFVPIADPTFDSSLLAVGPLASGVTDFRDVTGGVYKARERIHRSVADLRLLATPTSWGRVADPNPN